MRNQTQGTAGIARTGQPGAAACRPNATASAHPAAAVRGNASSQWRMRPGFRLHPLKADQAGKWSLRVSGNWRVVFRFENGEAVDVDLIDYH